MADLDRVQGKGRGGPTFVGDPVEEFAARVLADAADAELRAEALVRWARGARERVAAVRRGGVIDGPPSLKAIEAGLRRRKNRG